jgi:hypothetical protein
MPAPTIYLPNGSTVRGPTADNRLQYGTPVPPIPPLDATPADLKAESVSADGYAWLTAYAKTLPHWVDDLTRDFGDDLYHRMLVDAAVHAAITTLKASVLEGGVQLTPAVEDDAADGYATAVEILEFCQAVIEDLDIDLESVLWDLTDAFAFGNRLAEAVYEPRTVKGKRALALKALKPRLRETYAFVTDAYANLVGIMALIPGTAFAVLPGLVVGNPRDIPNLLPREKFAILTVNPRNSDPRGTSLLRPAYKPWWIKQQVWGEYLKYLTQFGSPIVVGIASPGAQQAPVAIPAPVPPVGPPPVNGQITWGAASPPLDPIGVLLAALQGIRNGGVVSVPAGTEVRIERAAGNGEAFLEAMDLLDRQITIAILNQTLATMEGKHMARAASETHQDVLSTLTARLKLLVTRFLRHEVLRPLVRWNFGDEAARALVPRVALGEEEGIDKPPLLTAYTGAGYTLDPSQFIGIDEELGAPERDPDSIQTLLEQRAQAHQAQLDGQQASTEATRAGIEQGVARGNGGGDRRDRAAPVSAAEPDGAAQHSARVMMAAGHWVTLHAEDSDEGTVHVFIGPGHVITKGPAGLVGADIRHLAGHGRQEHHPAGHEPAGARTHPHYHEHVPPERTPGKPYARTHGAAQTRQAQAPEPMGAEQAREALGAARAAVAPRPKKPPTPQEHPVVAAARAHLATLEARHAAVMPELRRHAERLLREDARRKPAGRTKEARAAWHDKAADDLATAAGEARAGETSAYGQLQHETWAHQRALTGYLDQSAPRRVALVRLGNELANASARLSREASALYHPVHERVKEHEFQAEVERGDPHGAYARLVRGAPGPRSGGEDTRALGEALAGAARAQAARPARPITAQTDAGVNPVIAERARAAFADLPAHHQAILHAHGLRLHQHAKEGYAFTDAKGGTGTASGNYDYRPHTINLFGATGDRGTMIHEAGHAIDHVLGILTGQDRTGHGAASWEATSGPPGYGFFHSAADPAFKRVFDRHEHNEALRHYMRTEPVEMFADAYRMYYDGPATRTKLLHDAPELYAYIERADQQIKEHTG